MQLVLEHQSSPNHNMALRLFLYMFKIAEYHKKATKSKKFPFIYPLIFYNGQKKYNAPRNLWELFENSELVKSTWTNDYQLINVHDIPDEKLKEKAWSGILQFFMKHIHERDLLKRWEEVADLLPKFAKIDIGIEHIELILCYTLTKIKQSDIIEVEKLLKSNKTYAMFGSKYLKLTLCLVLNIVKMENAAVVAYSHLKDLTSLLQ